MFRNYAREEERESKYGFSIELSTPLLDCAIKVEPVKGLPETTLFKDPLALIPFLDATSLANFAFTNRTTLHGVKNVISKTTLSRPEKISLWEGLQKITLIDECSRQLKKESNETLIRKACREITCRVPLIGILTASFFASITLTIDHDQKSHPFFDAEYPLIQKLKENCYGFLDRYPRYHLCGTESSVWKACLTNITATCNYCFSSCTELQNAHDGGKQELETATGYLFASIGVAIGGTLLLIKSWDKIRGICNPAYRSVNQLSLPLQEQLSHFEEIQETEKAHRVLTQLQTLKNNFIRRDFTVFTLFQSKLKPVTLPEDKEEKKFEP